MSKAAQITKLSLYKSYTGDQIKEVRGKVATILASLLKQRIKHRQTHIINGIGNLDGDARVQRANLNTAIKAAMIDRDFLDTHIWCRANRVKEGQGMEVHSKKLGRVYATLARIQAASGVVCLAFTVNIKGTIHNISTHVLMNEPFDTNKIP